MGEPRPLTRVLGVGNVLQGDDGFGPTVVRRFQAAWHCEPPVETIDAGTPGADLDELIDGAEHLVVVDAVLADQAPGSLRVLTDGQLRAEPDPCRLSPHQPGLLDSLARLRLLGRAPQRVLLLGAVPAARQTGTELSAPVRAVLPAAEAELRRLLEGLGHRVARRPDPPSPDLWWLRPDRSGADAAPSVQPP
jgi:hydrogenase maturation protease